VTDRVPAGPLTPPLQSFTAQALPKTVGRSRGGLLVYRRAPPPEDPVLTVARAAAASTQLLCLDELHVTDVADAMLLARLLRQVRVLTHDASTMGWGVGLTEPTQQHVRHAVLLGESTGCELGACASEATNNTVVY
jgi:hypothetical protein